MKFKPKDFEKVWDHFCCAAISPSLQKKVCDVANEKLEQWDKQKLIVGKVALSVQPVKRAAFSQPKISAESQLVLAL